MTISEKEKTRNTRLTMDKGQINPDKNITNFDDVSCIAFLKFDMNCNYWLTCIQEPYPDMAVRVFQDAQKSKFHGDRLPKLSILAFMIV